MRLLSHFRRFISLAIVPLCLLPMMGARQGVFLGQNLPISPAFVRSGAIGNGATSPQTSSLSSNAAGDVIIVAAEANTTTATPITFSISSTNGNTYTSCGPVRVLSTGATYQQFQLFYKNSIPASAGANTITTAAGGASYVATIAVEYSAQAGASCSGTGVGSSGTGTASASGNLIVNYGDLIIGWGTAALGTPAAGAGFTSRGATTFFIYEDGVFTSSPVNATATVTSGIWTMNAQSIR